MPIVSILTFFATFIFIVLVVLYLFLTFYNKRTRTATDKFIRQASELAPTVFKNIKLRYWTTTGPRTQISPNNHCDLYLFDNCLAIIRRQDFIFKVFFAPVLLTSDLATTKSNFNYLDCYKPDHIHFNQLMKGQVDIKLKDPISRHWKIDITFKELTSEQTNQLDKIKNWCWQLGQQNFGQRVAQPLTSTFVLLALTNSVFHHSVLYSAFYPGLTLTIKQQNMFCTLVLRSAAVAGGDVEMKSPTAQTPNVVCNLTVIF